MGRKSGDKAKRDRAQTAPSAFPTVRRTRAGQVQVSMNISLQQAAEVVSVPMTLSLAPEDLARIESTDRQKLGKELTRQLFFAALTLAPQEQRLLAPLQRRQFDAMAKRVASNLAKPIHAFVKVQMASHAIQTPEFSRALQVIRDTHNNNPGLADITAWLVEQYLWNQWGEIWDGTGLRRPTADPDRFAKKYLYTKPHVSPTPDVLQGGAALVALIVHGLSA